MPQIKRLSILPVLLFSLALISGCGDANPAATFDPESPEGHPSDWLPSVHAARASSSLSACTECHGEAFGGGISGTACTSCHLGSPIEVHPLNWGLFAYSRHGGYVEANGTSSCSVTPCHGPALRGVAGSGPSCTSCHLGGIEGVHPAEWGAFTYALHPTFVRANGTSSCANAACHGPEPELAGAEESGPPCSSCHLGDEIVMGAKVFNIHPTEWDLDFTLHGVFVASKGTASCSNITCHGGFLEGVLGSGISCFVCHEG